MKKYTSGSGTEAGTGPEAETRTEAETKMKGETGTKSENTNNKQTEGDNNERIGALIEQIKPKIEKFKNENNDIFSKYYQQIADIDEFVEICNALKKYMDKAEQEDIFNLQVDYELQWIVCKFIKNCDLQNIKNFDVLIEQFDILRKKYDKRRAGNTYETIQAEKKKEKVELEKDDGKNADTDLKNELEWELNFLTDMDTQFDELNKCNKTLWNKLWKWGYRGEGESDKEGTKEWDKKIDKKIEEINKKIIKIKENHDEHEVDVEKGVELKNLKHISPLTRDKY